MVARFLVALFAGSLVLVVGSACSGGDCPSSCQSDYNHCMETAPPGAARTDCGTAYDHCMASCN
jgi:hypothetical protein